MFDSKTSSNYIIASLISKIGLFLSGGAISVMYPLVSEIFKIEKIKLF